MQGNRIKPLRVCPRRALKEAIDTTECSTKTVTALNRPNDALIRLPSTDKTRRELDTYGVTSSRDLHTIAARLNTTHRSSLARNLKSFHRTFLGSGEPALPLVECKLAPLW